MDAKSRGREKHGVEMDDDKATRQRVEFSLVPETPNDITGTSQSSSGIPTSQGLLSAIPLQSIPLGKESTHRVSAMRLFRLFPDPTRNIKLPPVDIQRHPL